MTTGVIVRLGACRQGVSAIEMALVLTIFLGLLFGIINVSLLLWTQASLYYAVQAAARSASVNETNSGSPADSETVKAYAMSQYYGQPLGRADVFKYNSPSAGCGHTVSTVDGLTYDMPIPFYGQMSINLSATACFP